MAQTLRIGTRASLLAKAQTRQAMAALTARTPGLSVELVEISTVGDENTSQPLWAFGETGVFSRALDERLLAGDIDVAVHSLKDLGTQRPSGLVTAAIPPRRNPRDVVLYRADVPERLAAGATLRLGSSAPRRITLLPRFLAEALPRLSAGPPAVEVTPIRGNVITRLARLSVDRSDPKALDGVVLALAGLSRLYEDEGARPVLAEHLSGLLWQVLPLTVSPGAPGQGALAIEAREEDHATCAILAAIHDPATAAAVARERSVLLEHGGGCHQRFGVIALDLPGLATPLVITAGEDSKGRDISGWRGAEAPQLDWWRAGDWRAGLTRIEPLDVALPEAPATFVALDRAVPAGARLSGRVWVSGVSSWKRLAARGTWIEGCADGFGAAFVRDTCFDPVLGLPAPSEWAILTHADAIGGWAETWGEGARATATYRVHHTASPDALAALRRAGGVYWTSPGQFHAFLDQTRPDAVHACGPGKTADALRAAGITPLVLPRAPDLAPDLAPASADATA